MTFKEYELNYADKDHILIRITDSFPYFKDKVIVSDGKKTTETNFHVANGMFSTYINYETPQGGISAEVEHGFMLEISCDYDFPVFITNVGEKCIEAGIRSRADELKGDFMPGEIYAIYPDEIAEDTYRKIKADAYRRYTESINGKGQGFLSQDEINKLLGE